MHNKEVYNADSDRACQGVGLSSPGDRHESMKVLLFFSLTLRNIFSFETFLRNILLEFFF